MTVYGIDESKSLVEVNTKVEFNELKSSTDSKLYRLVKIYNNTEVVQLPGNADIFPFLSRQNIADRLGVNVSSLNMNNVIFAGINGDSNSNGTRLTGAFYVMNDNNLYLNFRDIAYGGGYRVNYILLYFSDNDEA